MAMIPMLSLIVTLFTFLLIHSTNAQLGAMMEIEDVKHNKEVQELGKYSVEEYNKKIGGVTPSNMVLSFVEVTQAKKQTVSGTKYYLRIVANENGVKKMFESKIDIKPWMKKSSKTLLGFRKSTGN